MHNRALAKVLSQTLTLGLLAAFLLAGCRSPSPTVTEISIATEIPTAGATPTARERECPTMMCIDTLGVYLVGFRSDDFTLTATTPDGTRVQVRCVDYTGQSGGSLGRVRVECGGNAGLRPRSVVFFGFTPEILTVTLTWDGNEISQEFEPEYNLYQPAGPDCPPTCRTGGVVLNVLESP
jgi:hypothetical protein